MATYNQILNQIKTTDYYHNFLETLINGLFNFEAVFVTKAVNTFLNLVLTETDNLTNRNCLYDLNDSQKVMKNILTRQAIPFSMLMTKFQNIATDNLGDNSTYSANESGNTKVGYAGFDISNQEGEFQTNTFDTNKGNSVSKTNTLQTIRFINRIKQDIIPTVYNEICEELIVSIEGV